MADDASRKAQYEEVIRYLSAHFPGAEIAHSTEGLELDRDAVAFRAKQSGEVWGASILHDVLDDAFDPGQTDEARRAGVRHLLVQLGLADKTRSAGGTWLWVRYGES
jgi:hypothetical protein